MHQDGIPAITISLRDLPRHLMCALDLPVEKVNFHQRGIIYGTIAFFGGEG